MCDQQSGIGQELRQLHTEESRGLVQNVCEADSGIFRRRLRFECMDLAALVKNETVRKCPPHVNCHSGHKLSLCVLGVGLRHTTRRNQPAMFSIIASLFFWLWRKNLRGQRGAD